MDLVDNITKNLDGGNYSIGIFLDLSKAFDTIDHTILLDVSMKVTCGVPQGIHIRTTTVHLYINDIANVSNIFKINLFADDTSLFHTHEHFESFIKETNQ